MSMKQIDQPDDDDLLRQARALMPPVDAEPRPGFAGRVAARALEENTRPALFGLWRWAMGGAVAMAAAAALFVALTPHNLAPGTSMELASNDRMELMARAPGGELAVAQQLDLYEDLAVVQNEDALEDMDVVAVLHELQPEAKP